MSRFNGKRILVVDDEDLIRELLAEELVFCGADVDSAENGMVAIEKLKKSRFDLILSDFRMPVCDGFKMAKTIQKDFLEKPIIIICTGYNNAITDENARDAGISFIIEKPFELSVVIDVVAKYLKLG